MLLANNEGARFTAGAQEKESIHHFSSAGLPTDTQEVSSASAKTFSPVRYRSLFVAEQSGRCDTSETGGSVTDREPLPSIERPVTT